MNIRQEPLAAQDGGDKTLLFRQIHLFGGELLDTGIFGEIVLDKLFRLRHGDAVFTGEALGAHAVNDAEVDGLGLVTLGFGNFLHRRPKDQRGGAGMDVFVLFKRGDEIGIFRDMGQDPQFHLGIVRRNENMFGVRGYKGPADAPAKFGADRNILKIGVGGAEPACGRDGLIERRMDAFVVGMNQVGQDIQISVLELGKLAVIQNHVGDGNALEGFQHVHIGGVARLGFFNPGAGFFLNLHFLEKNLAQL